MAHDFIESSSEGYSAMHNHFSNSVKKSRIILNPLSSDFARFFTSSVVGGRPNSLAYVSS